MDIVPPISMFDLSREIHKQFWWDFLIDDVPK